MPTKIEWVINPDGTQGETWNPITGCTKKSEGCQNCYAEAMHKRFGKGTPFSDVVFHENRIEQPFRWKKPRMIFVCSMSDLFHEKVNTSDVDYILEAMSVHGAERHLYVVLTKRAENIHKKLYGITDEHPLRELGGGDYLPNLMIGVSVENQKRADERLPLLLNDDIKCGAKIVSVEPMLGPVDLSKYLDKLDWVICGGETGPRARECSKRWIVDLAEQCSDKKVPFFFKHWGLRSPLAGFVNRFSWLDVETIRQMPKAWYKLKYSVVSDGQPMAQSNARTFLALLRSGPLEGPWVLEPFVDHLKQVFPGLTSKLKIIK